MADPRGGHADHDLLLVVASIDGDVTAAERAAVETILATCPDCAALRADTVLLSKAARELPTPVRPRDFRLTAADAARLAAAAPGEPSGSTSRLADVMTARTTNPDHAGHDPMLVASLADHSLATTERMAAETLVATCVDCAALQADFLALRDATRAMPTPARPRDYTLTAADAARLRRGGWRRLVAAFGSSRDALSRPLAVGLTTLGLAGLLLASVPSMLPQSGATVLSTVGSAVGNGAGQPAAAPADSTAGPVAAASAAAAPLPEGAQASAAPPFGAYRPEASAGSSAVPVSGDLGVKGAAPGAGQGARATPDTAGGQDGLGSGASAATGPSVPTLVLVSGAFLIVGLALFAIRWSARRLGDG